MQVYLYVSICSELYKTKLRIKVESLYPIFKLIFKSSYLPEIFYFLSIVVSHYVFRYVQSIEIRKGIGILHLNVVNVMALDEKCNESRV